MSCSIWREIQKSLHNPGKVVSRKHCSAQLEIPSVPRPLYNQHRTVEKFHLEQRLASGQCCWPGVVETVYEGCAQVGESEWGKSTEYTIAHTLELQTVVSDERGRKPGVVS